MRTVICWRCGGDGIDRPRPASRRRIKVGETADGKPILRRLPGRPGGVWRADDAQPPWER